MRNEGTIILRESTVSKVQELSLYQTGIGPDGAKAVATLCAAMASVTSVSLLRNQFNDETVAMLLQLKEDKPNLTTLCGLKPDQTEADFSYCTGA